MSGTYSGLGVAAPTEPTLKKYPGTVTQFESRTLWRFTGSLRPPLDPFGTTAGRFCQQYAKIPRLQKIPAARELCTLHQGRIKLMLDGYKQRGRFVPAGSLRQGEVVTRRKAERYGLDTPNFKYPGACFGAKQRSVVVDVIRAGHGLDDIILKCEQVDDIPAEPPPKKPGYDFPDPPLPPPPPAPGTPGKAVPTTPGMVGRNCSGVRLYPGQIVLPKGQLNVGDVLNTAWGKKFAATKPPLKGKRKPKKDEVFQLYISEINPCSITHAIYTARYRFVSLDTGEITPEEPPAPPTEPDQPRPPGGFDPMPVPEPPTPAEPVAAAGLPVWGWLLIAGVGFTLITKGRNS